MAIRPLDLRGALSVSKRLDCFGAPIGGAPRNDILKIFPSPDISHSPRNHNHTLRQIFSLIHDCSGYPG